MTTVGGTVVDVSVDDVFDIEGTVATIREEYATGYSSIEIPEGITEIRGSESSGPRDFTSVTFPSTITSIGDNAFSGCESLHFTSFPKNVVEIGSYAFSGCSNLQFVTIDARGSMTIGEDAFSNCPSMTSLRFKHIKSVSSMANYPWGLDPGVIG